MGNALSGLSADEISDYFPIQRHISREGWFGSRTHRETLIGLQERVSVVYEWLLELRDLQEYDTVIMITHGAFMARLIRKVLSIPSENWITHANIAMTSFLWDKEKGLLLEGINRTAHIPVALHTGDSPKDGWWPAIYHREVVFLSLREIPTVYVYLYKEILDARPDRTEENIDERSIFFCGFFHHTLCGFVQYDPKEKYLYPMVRLSSHEDLYARLGTYVEEQIQNSTVIEK
jgi:hypothetical protein